MRCWFPFDLRTAPSVRLDVVVYLVRKFTDFAPGLIGAAVTAGLTKLTFNALAQAFGARQAASPGHLAALLCGLALFTVREFADYGMHYLEHKNPVLWELHKVHHSAEVLTPLTAVRGHSLGVAYHAAVGGACSGTTAGVFMFVFGFSLPETLLLGGLTTKAFALGSLDPLKHSHFPVRLGPVEWVLISPHMHQVHHSRLQPHLDKNFGTNLSVFDWLFRTAYRPKVGEMIELGLHGHDAAAMRASQTLRAAYVTPLVRMSRVAVDAWRTVNPRPRAVVD